MNRTCFDTKDLFKVYWFILWEKDFYSLIYWLPKCLKGGRIRMVLRKNENKSDEEEVLYVVY